MFVQLFLATVSLSLCTSNPIDLQVNLGSGSTQIQTGGSGFGTQINVDPSGSSTQYQNGHYNPSRPPYPSQYPSGGPGAYPSRPAGGPGAYPGGNNVFINGEDYSGVNVNRPGLQVNHSPGNYQYHP